MNRTAFASSILMLCFSTSAQADTLLASFDYLGTGQTTALQEWQPFLSYGDPDDPASAFMNEVTLDFVDVAQGNQYELTGDFAPFSAFASDDANQALYIGIRVPGGSGSQQLTDELNLLAGASGLAPGVGAPDFAGYNLTRIVVQGSSFQAGVNGTFEAGTNFSVFGDRAVPEPTSLGLLLVAAGALACQRRSP